MSTNLYLIRDACVCCGLQPEPIHLGKITAGGFIGRIYPDPDDRPGTVSTLHPGPVAGMVEWWALIRAAARAEWRVQDEYGRPWTFEQLTLELTERPMRHFQRGEFS